MIEIQENKPFRINFKNKDQTIFHGSRSDFKDLL